MSFRLDGRIALVTGGAQGLGEASGRIMAQQGARVVLADINIDGAIASAEAITAAGGEAVAVAFDAFDKNSIRKMIAEVQNRFGRIDILHNNVGGSFPNRDLQVLDVDDDDWMKIFDWNMHSAHWATKAVLPGMIEHGKGAIVNTITSGANISVSIQTAYGASKAALASYTRYVAVQYGRRGIRCNAVYPGMVLSAGAIKHVPQPYLDTVYEQISTVRMGVPDDIGYAVAYLASDAAGYVNGESINVDGTGRRGGHDAAAVRTGAYGPTIPVPPDLIVPK